MSAEAHKDEMITLISKEQHEFVISKDAARISGTLRSILDNPGIAFCFPSKEAYHFASAFSLGSFIRYRRHSVVSRTRSRYNCLRPDIDRDVGQSDPVLLL